MHEQISNNYSVRVPAIVCFCHGRKNITLPSLVAGSNNPILAGLKRSQSNKVKYKHIGGTETFTKQQGEIQTYWRDWNVHKQQGEIQTLLIWCIYSDASRSSEKGAHSPFNFSKGGPWLFRRGPPKIYVVQLKQEITVSIDYIFSTNFNVG